MPIISKEIKLALLGISAIVLFVIGYNYLKGTGLFSSTREIFTEYDDVQGLTPASYVQLQGFNIGTVKEIELSKAHPGKVKVTLSVDKLLSIPEDSKASIISTDLLGSKAVNLILGQSKSILKENGSLQGEIRPGVIDNLGASAGPALDRASQAIASLDTTIHSINNILDQKGQDHLKHAIADMSQSMKEFNEFSKNLNAQQAKINELVSNLNSFANNLEKNGPTLTKVLNNAEVATANLKKVDFEGTINELKKTLDDLQLTLDKVNHGKGSMAMLLNDDQLYRNLKNTLATTNTLLADIGARPSRYISVSVFGRKNKKDTPPQPAPNAND